MHVTMTCIEKGYFLYTSDILCIEKLPFLYMMQTLREIIEARPFWETTAVLKKQTTANRYLAELKGVSASVPNPAILINALLLEEAKDSSAIENIFTTRDELYQETLIMRFVMPALW